MASLILDLLTYLICCLTELKTTPPVTQRQVIASFLHLAFKPSTQSRDTYCVVILIRPRLATSTSVGKRNDSRPCSQASSTARCWSCSESRLNVNRQLNFKFGLSLQFLSNLLQRKWAQDSFTRWCILIRNYAIKPFLSYYNHKYVTKANFFLWLYLNLWMNDVKWI